MKAQGDFTPSEFVKKITGADNVCERSAVLGAAKGKLIKKKTGGRCYHCSCAPGMGGTF